MTGRAVTKRPKTIRETSKFFDEKFDKTHGHTRHVYFTRLRSIVPENTNAMSANRARVFGGKTRFPCTVLLFLFYFNTTPWMYFVFTDLHNYHGEIRAKTFLPQFVLHGIWSWNDGYRLIKKQFFFSNTKPYETQHVCRRLFPRVLCRIRIRVQDYDSYRTTRWRVQSRIPAASEPTRWNNNNTILTMPYAAAVRLSWRIKSYDCAVLLILGGARVSIIYAYFLGTKSRNKKRKKKIIIGFDKHDVKIHKYDI